MLIQFLRSSHFVDLLNLQFFLSFLLLLSFVFEVFSFSLDRSFPFDPSYFEDCWNLVYSHGHPPSLTWRLKGIKRTAYNVTTLYCQFLSVSFFLSDLMSSSRHQMSSRKRGSHHLYRPSHSHLLPPLMQDLLSFRTKIDPSSLGELSFPLFPGATPLSAITFAFPRTINVLSGTSKFIQFPNPTLLKKEIVPTRFASRRQGLLEEAPRPPVLCSPAGLIFFSRHSPSHTFMCEGSVSICPRSPI